MLKTALIIYCMGLIPFGIAGFINAMDVVDRRRKNHTIPEYLAMGPLWPILVIATILIGIKRAVGRQLPQRSAVQLSRRQQRAIMFQKAEAAVVKERLETQQKYEALLQK